MDAHQAGRRERLRARLDEAGLTALLVVAGVNVRYLTGLVASNAAVLVSADGGGQLVTDGRYAEQAEAALEGVTDLGLVISREDDWLRARRGELRRLGLESDRISWDRARTLTALLDGVELVPAPGHVEALRACKDAVEEALLRRACEVTVDALSGVVVEDVVGQTERELARRFAELVTEQGGDGLAFPSIVAAGPHAARPHHESTDRPVALGDVLKLDVGAAVGGYAADCTRMFAVGEVPEVLVRVHDVVRRAQRAGVSAVRDGVTAGGVDAACRELIVGEGYGERFTHGSGHGLGLEIHEQPILRAGSTATLRSRMAVTVEPGVYLPGVGGIRIEDTVLVGERGCEILTDADRDLVQIARTA